MQVFSVRWHEIDEVMNGATWVIHSLLLGVIHRYLVRNVTRVFHFAPAG